MSHKPNCLVNVDRECGYCTCGADAKENDELYIKKLEAENAALRGDPRYIDRLHFADGVKEGRAQAHDDIRCAIRRAQEHGAPLFGDNDTPVTIDCADAAAQSLWCRIEELKREAAALTKYERPVKPPHEAAGCVACDTCGGYRSVGQPCAFCAGRTTMLVASRTRLLTAAQEAFAMLNSGLGFKGANAPTREALLLKIGEALRTLGAAVSEEGEELSVNDDEVQRDKP